MKTKLMSKNHGKIINNAEEIQDEIFRKMSGAKKFKITCEMSEHILKLNKKYGIQQANI